MKPKESPLPAKKKVDFPVDRRTVLRIALEDAETSHFILKYFSHPEEKPQIFSRKRMILQDRRFKWLIELIEKVPFCFNGKKEMLNIARIEIDPFCGEIVDRQYFKNLFEDEYRKIVNQRK